MSQTTKTKQFDGQYENGMDYLEIRLSWVSRQSIFDVSIVANLPSFLQQPTGFCSSNPVVLE